MKEIECKKCGQKYDSNYKSCPHCGNNPFRNTLLGILIGLCVFMLAATFANSIVLLINQKATFETLNEQIANISTNSSGQQTSEGVDLANYPEITDAYGISDETNLDVLAKDHLLYFYQKGCVNCEISNQYIVSYYYLDLNDVLPIYLVNLEGSEKLFEKYNVDGTPTIIRITDGKEVERGVGFEETFNIMDPIVRENTNQ